MSLSNEQLAIQIQLREDLQHTPPSVVEHCARLTIMWQREKEQKEELIAALRSFIHAFDKPKDFDQSYFEPEVMMIRKAISKATGKEPK